MSEHAKARAQKILTLALGLPDNYAELLLAYAMGLTAGSKKEGDNEKCTTCNANRV